MARPDLELDVQQNQMMSPVSNEFSSMSAKQNTTPRFARQLAGELDGGAPDVEQTFARDSRFFIYVFQNRGVQLEDSAEPAAVRKRWPGTAGCIGIPGRETNLLYGSFAG